MSKFDPMREIFKSLPKSILLTWSFLVLFSSFGISQDERGLVIKDQPYLLPFVWATNVDNVEAYKSIVNGELEHPLTVGRTAFTYLLIGDSLQDDTLLKRGKEMVDYLSGYPHQQSAGNSTVYVYPTDYRDLPGGSWWSGMANSAVAMAYLKAYEVFNDRKYLNRAERCINGVMNTPDNNGCAVVLSDSAHWYLEYSTYGRNEENSYFVHNGFLFSVVALKYFSEVTGQDVYEQAYRRGLNAMHERESLYYYDKDQWTYYMTNPLTIESAHYMVYELILLESLQFFEDDDRIQSYIDRRRKIAIREYPVFKSKGNKISFAAPGAPHPYWPDIYPTRIRIEYDHGFEEMIISPRDMSVPSYKRLFASLPLGKDIKSISVFQDYNHWSFLLYKIDQLADVSSNDHGSIACKLLPGYDSRHNGENDFSLFKTADAETNRGLVRYQFNEPIDLYKQRYFGFVFRSQIEITNMRIILINTEGETAERYYLPQPDSVVNLVLVKGISFNYYEKIKNKAISEIQVNYYYPQFEEDSMDLEVSPFFYYNDPMITRDILGYRYGDVNFVEKTVPGNIY